MLSSKLHSTATSRRSGLPSGSLSRTPSTAAVNARDARRRRRRQRLLFGDFDAAAGKGLPHDIRAAVGEALLADPHATARERGESERDECAVEAAKSAGHAAIVPSRAAKFKSRASLKKRANNPALARLLTWDKEMFPCHASHPRSAVSLGWRSAASLGACAQTDATSRVASTVPVVSRDVAGAGGKMDEIYRQIYTPGDPISSH